MAKQGPSGAGLAAAKAAVEATGSVGLLDDPGDDAGFESPTPAAQQESSEQVAQRPEIQEAFAAVFGKSSGTKAASTGTSAEAGRKPATRATRQQAEEQAEELDGLKGDELDDGAEAEGDEKPAEQPAKPEAVRKPGKEAAEVDPNAPTLDPILRHAAKRAGWKDEQIDGLFVKDPDMMTSAAKRLLESFNEQSAFFGRLGRLPGLAAGQPPVQPQAAPGQEPDVFAPVFTKAQVDTFRAKYGDDYVEEIIKPMLKHQATVLAPLQAEASRRQLSAIRSETLGFFKGLPEALTTIYGKGDRVEGEQLKARMGVCERADQIRAGAAQQGQELSVSECLDYANMELAASHLAQMERQKITASVTRRSKTLTQRPSQKIPSASSAPTGDQAAMDAYEQRASELGIELGGE